MHWRRKWQPTPVFLPGESQGWGSLVGSRLRSHRVRHDWSDLAAAAPTDVFLEFSCFFDDPADVGRLISGSSAFSKTSLNIWKFTVHVLLKPGLENFEHYFTSVWNECNCAVVWASLALSYFGIGMKTDLFQSCGHCWVFQICWHIECSIFTALSFRIWNSSTEIPSPPLALFVVMLPKSHLTSYSRMSGRSGECLVSDHTIVIIWVMKIFFV